MDRCRLRLPHLGQSISLNKKDDSSVDNNQCGVETSLVFIAQARQASKLRNGRRCDPGIKLANDFGVASTSNVFSHPRR